MANTSSTQIIVDGPRNVVLKFEGVLDTSDLGSTVVVDPAVLAGIDNTGLLKAVKFRIDSIQYNIKDPLSVVFYWDATVPVRIEQLTARGHLEYHIFGGLFDNAGAGLTGKILAATQGWSAGLILPFSIIMRLVKTQ